MENGKQIIFQVLKKGDSVLNAWDNHIAIKKKNGDVEIIHYDLDENGFPRISKEYSILITHGKDIVRIKDNSLEAGTF